MNFKIKNFFIITGLLIFVMSLISTFLIYQSNLNVQKLEQIELNKVEMYQKIFELRSNIDNLTRFSRTYVVTKESRYKKNYLKILDMMKGVVNKPLNYNSTYWHLFEPNKTIHHPIQKTKPLPLLKEMYELPYIKYEFDLLKEALFYWEKLSELERRAFEVLESKENHQSAIDLLFSDDYHKLKEKTMLPIDKFVLSLENRTKELIETYNNKSANLYNKLYIFIFIGILLFMIAFIIIQLKILKPLNTLNKHIKNYNKGKKVSTIKFYKDEIGLVINNFFQMKKEVEKNIKKLKTLSSVDKLTQTFNRHAFNEKIFEVIKNSNKTKSTFSILLLDIDYFKKINDTYGHSVGDDVLKFISNKIKRLLSENDFICRWGGEEFLIVLPDTNKNDAFKVAERIRQKIENSNFIFEDEKINITVSLGVSQYKDSDRNIKVLIDRADDALYKAKNEGRNTSTIL